MTTSAAHLQDHERIAEIEQALAALKTALENNEWERLTEGSQRLHAAIAQAVAGITTPEGVQSLKSLLEQCQAFYTLLIQRSTQYRNGLAKELQATQRGMTAANAYLKTSIG